MPKTADKRAKARRAQRVTRAHQTVLEHQPVRRVRPAARRRKKSGFSAAVSRVPLASTFFALVVVLGIGWLLFANRSAWLPKSPQAHHQPSCNLKTHVCDKPAMTIDQSKLYIATIHTARGDIVIQMNPKVAPQAVNNFVYLARQHFFDGLTFWRIEHKGQPSQLNPGGAASTLDLIQGGDPKGDGSGGPGYSLPNETVVGDYVAGAVAMAGSSASNGGTTISGSQFFICTGNDSGAIAKNYTIFGQVTSGLNVAQNIQKNDKMLSVTIAVQPQPTPTATSAPTATATATPGQ
jgi:cyclophilin family peptidyl-prolyl cis-trans isomerase